MILSFFRKRTAPEPVFAVYNAIVAQSRQPMLYAQWGVPDTVTGRFDMISLHMALLFRRLRSRAGAEHDFAQAVFDLFFKDMDRSLREMGVTDIGVPKKIEKMGTLFFGLLAAINQAMDTNDVGALAAVLSRNIYGEDASEHAPALARYTFDHYDALARQSADEIVAGRITMGVVS